MASLGKLLVETYTWQDRWRSPLIVRGGAQESDHPWRTGRCILVRLPFVRRAVGIGIWTGKQPQGEDDLGPYLEMREIDWDEVSDVPGRKEAG